MSQLEVQTAQRRPVMSRFLTGARAPLDGFAYLWRRPALWRYAVIPLMVNIVVSLVVLVGMIMVVGATLAYLEWQFPSSLWWHVALKVLAGVVLLILALGAALIAYFILGGILSGYFNTRLARQVELALGTPAEHLHEVPFWYQVYDTVRDLLVLTGINIGCLFLNIIPGVGAAASLYFDWYVFGVDYMDYPMSLRGMRRGEKKIVTWRRYRPETLGLGAVVFGFNFVPVVGGMILTTAAVGAVLLYHKVVIPGEGLGEA